MKNKSSPLQKRTWTANATTLAKQGDNMRWSYSDRIYVMRSHLYQSLLITLGFRKECWACLIPVWLLGSELSLAMDYVYHLSKVTPTVRNKSVLRMHSEVRYRCPSKDRSLMVTNVRKGNNANRCWRVKWLKRKSKHQMNSVAWYAQSSLFVSALHLRLPHKHVRVCVSNEFIHDIFMLLIVHIYEHLGAPKSNLCDFEVLLLFAFSNKKLCLKLKQLFNTVYIQTLWPVWNWNDGKNMMVGKQSLISCNFLLCGTYYID